MATLKVSEVKEMVDATDFDNAIFVRTMILGLKVVVSEEIATLRGERMGLASHMVDDILAFDYQAYLKSQSGS